jgi:predicted dithiol-disulfide oxidoreductase (DUF899 family)
VSILAATFVVPYGDIRNDSAVPHSLCRLKVTHFTTESSHDRCTDWMYGSKRKRSCPMCASLLGSLDGEMPDILQRVAFAVIARSPIERLMAFKTERGWRHLRLYSSGSNSFNRDYADEDPDGDDHAGFNVFTRTGGVVRHFCGDEMGPETADPGQDPRGAPDLMPVWAVLDMTPGGRGTDWYPKLDYGVPKAD